MWFLTLKINQGYLLAKKFREGKKYFHMIFGVCKNAFNSIPSDFILTALRSHDIPEVYVNIIKDMYHLVTSRIRCTVGISESFLIKVGVDQESVSSPYFSVKFMNEVLLSVLVANDLGLVDEDVDKLQEILNH